MADLLLDVWLRGDFCMAPSCYALHGDSALCWKQERQSARFHAGSAANEVADASGHVRHLRGAG